MSREDSASHRALRDKASDLDGAPNMERASVTQEPREIIPSCLLKHNKAHLSFRECVYLWHGDNGAEKLISLAYTGSYLSPSGSQLPVLTEYPQVAGADYFFVWREKNKFVCEAFSLLAVPLMALSQSSADVSPFNNLQDVLLMWEY